MAPKRSAPPPPRPPAASSEDTAAGSDSDESEEEVAPASPVLTSKNPPRAPKKGAESETSDEEEEEDEEEEDEEGEKTTQLNLPSAPAPKNTPPPPREVEESDTSGEDEEEEGETSESEQDKAPPPKPSPKQAAEGKRLKPSSAEEAKKPVVPFHRAWSTDDEVRILEALAARRREHGALPQIDVLFDALAGSLDNRGYGHKELKSKVQTLKRRYDTFSKKGELPSKDHGRRLFNLSKSVWGNDNVTTDTVATKANGGAVRKFDEMCDLYPFLAEEVNALEAAHPGLFKGEFGKVDDEKAAALDVKIKKRRLARMKVEQRRSDLTKEVTKTLMDLIQ